MIFPRTHSSSPFCTSVVWRGGRFSLRGKLLVLCLACPWIGLPGGGCQEYRIEYHTRPGFFQQASEQRLPDRVVTEDGTIILYGTRERPATPGTGDAVNPETNSPLQIREDRSDGTVVLRCLVPHHVLQNTLTCLQLAEFDLLYEQLIAQSTKDAYEMLGKKPQPEVIAFFTKHRIEIARTLKYMIAGLPLQRVKMVNGPEGITRFLIRPQFARSFKFTKVDLIREGRWYKLKLVS